MDFTLNLVTLIDLLGLLQGLILGTIILAMSARNKAARIFLVLFIFSYSLGLNYNIFDFLGLKLSDNAFVPLNFNWLLFPLFYIYAQEISILSKTTDYKTLIAATIALLIESIAYFAFAESYFLGMILDFIEMTFGIVVGVLIIRFIQKHLAEVKNQYSYFEKKELLWIQVFALGGIISIGLILPIIIFEMQNLVLDVILSAINVGLLYWVSIRGALQPKVVSFLTADSSDLTVTAEKKREVSSQIDLKEMDKIVEKLNQLLQETESYCHHDITINDISKALKIHPKRLSTTLNQHLSVNFNTYINHFRIIKAKAMLKDSQCDHFSMEGIGNEVGFLSKSSFYRAFKKELGITPNDYKIATK